MLFSHLSSFSYAYHAVLRPYAQPGPNPNTVEPSTADVNHTFIGMKLWIMLAQKAAVANNAGDLNPFSVWNELWPPFEGLIDVFELEVRAGQSLVSSRQDTRVWTKIDKSCWAGPRYFDNIFDRRPFHLLTHTAHSNCASYVESYFNPQSTAEPWTGRNNRAQGTPCVFLQVIDDNVIYRLLVRCGACLSHRLICRSMFW